MSAPKILKGKCVIQALFLPEIGKFNEANARFQTQHDPSNFVSQSYYERSNSNVTSRLKSVTQSGGGLLPHTNPYLGAPMATFIYGSLAPNEAHPQLNLITGPDDKSTYVDVNGNTTTYNPKFTDPPAQLSGISGEGANSAKFTASDDKIPGAIQYPTIPSTNINPILGGTGGKALPTYNIWQVVNVVDGDISIYTKNYGTKFSDNYEGARVTQQASADGGMHLNVTAPNTQAEVRRIFPIAKDLMYSGAKLYYPKTTNDNVSGGPDPRDIKARGGTNSGFQMHFSHSSLGQSTNTQGELNGGIKIKWGLDNPTDKDKVELFVLQLSPSHEPELYYYLPENVTEDNSKTLWQKIPLQGPLFGTGQYSVYVHYNGPQMMIGFDADPSQWNVIYPPDIQDAQTGKPNGDYRFINLTDESYVSVIFSNITTTFTYGPVAFNNYHPENWIKGYDDRGRYQFTMTAPKDQIDHLDEAKLNAYFQHHKYDDDRYSLDNITVQPDDAKAEAPSYYCDRRNSNEHVTYQEISRSTSDDGKNVTVVGEIVFDTTVEGPQFQWIRATTIPVDRTKAPDVNKDNTNAIIRSLDPWGDISSYLSDWKVDYQCVEDSRSQLKGTARVTLMNLGLTPQGRQILNVLKRNITVMTVGAGYQGDMHNYFQGVVKMVETTRDGNGTKTVVSLEDVASYLFRRMKFPRIAAFGSMKYGDVLMSIMEMNGLLQVFDEQKASVGKATEDEPFQKFTDALNFRLNPVLHGKPLIGKVLVTNINQTLDEVIRPLLSLIINRGAVPILRWDPEAKKGKPIKLSWRNDQAFIDTLYFAGFRDSNDAIVLPDDPHGVLITDGWNEKVILDQLYAGVFLLGQDRISSVIQYKEIDSSAYGEEAYQALKNSVADDAEDSDTDLRYVGAQIIYLSGTSGSLYIGDQKTLDNFGDELMDDYVRTPYESISFGVHVTKPLNHFGRFYIKTFHSSDEVTNSSENTYFYKSVSYTFDKAQTVLTANIEGEILPTQILNGLDNASTVGVNLG